MPDGGMPLGPTEIGTENQQPGTPGWRLERVSRNGEIEGYAKLASVAPGEVMPIAVSTSTTTSFRWELYRLGHYAGAQARRVASGGPLAASPQPACPMDPTTGLIACGWSTTLAVRIDPGWVHGVYLLKLIRADGLERFVPFLVRPRDTAARGEALVVIPTATWEAYNRYGGESLYDDDEREFAHGHAFQVSFDRPYLRDDGAGDLLTHDLALIDWIESLGVDVDYVSSPELDAAPSLLHGRRVVLLSGHDEYWSHGIRAAMDEAVAGGTSLILLGANAGYWQVRYGASADGRPGRVITGYKEDAPTRDPVGPQSPLLTGRFRDPPVSLPESRLFGVMYQGFHQFGFPEVVSRTGPAWVFEGTGFSPGDTVWGIAGYEFDAIPDDAQTPRSEVLMDAPAFGINRLDGHAQMVLRENGSALVFSAGGIDAVRALAPGAYADPRFSRLVWNVLSRAIGKTLPPPPPLEHPSSPPIRTDAQAVTTIAGIAGQRGDVDGPFGVARFSYPVAVAALPDGALVVADYGADKLKRAERDGTVHTLAIPGLGRPAGLAVDHAGRIFVADSFEEVIFVVNPDGSASVLAGQLGVQGSADGPGPQASFETPLGMALTRDGRLLVADLANDAIRAVDPTTGAVSTFAKGLYRPSAVAVEPDGTIDVVESGMSRVVQLGKDGFVPLTAVGPGFQDGPASEARLQPFLGLVALGNGRLVVSDPGSERLRLISGGQVTTLAGSGRFGTADGPGASADFALPGGLAVGSDGTIYLADTGNGAIRAIRP